MEIKEFEIPVPWGHIAVKTWGTEKNTPVLTIHGLADNASSFDGLIPLLPTSFYYICIDLPSHGRSSPFPPHTFISAINNLYTYKIVVDYFKREQYIIMGHSWGAQIAILFTQLYPEHVLKLIMLDSVYLVPIETGFFKEAIKGRIEDLLRVNQNIATKPVPLYTYEEAVEKLTTSRLYGELTPEAAKALLKRSLVQESNGKFRFTTDPRLKVFLNPMFNKQYGLTLLKKYPLMCPILIIVASESELVSIFFKQYITQLQKANKKCIVKRVIGNHDVHNNNPEIVAPIVSKFLTYSKSKL